MTNNNQVSSFNEKTRVLGIAFLIQSIIPIFGGLRITNQLIVPGKIHESLINIANNVMQMRINIFSELISALGIIFLGSLLYNILKKHGQRTALIALGFYIFEAVMIAVSRIETNSLINISREYAAA